MQIQTTRFDAVEINLDDLLLLPNGLLGVEHCRHWVLLEDVENDAVGWLQSATHPEVAMAVISPRRFVPDYQLRVTRGQLTPLELEAVDQAYILALVSKNHGQLTLNLKAPLIVNLQRRLGRQIIANDDQPIQYSITSPTAPLRKTA